MSNKKTWNTVPNDQVIDKTVAKLKERNFNPVVVATKAEVLQQLKNLIPAGSTVMTGSSVSLNQVGVTELLQSSDSPWKNLNGEVWSENDQAKRDDMRRSATASPYFIASVNAVTQDGQLVSVDATGSRVSAYPFSAKNLILVVGAQKITESLDAAMQRIKEYVFPLEDERAQQAYGVHSTFGKWVIMEYEINPQRVHIILVKEDLGY